MTLNNIFFSLKKKIFKKILVNRQINHIINITNESFLSKNQVPKNKNSYIYFSDKEKFFIKNKMKLFDIDYINHHYYDGDFYSRPYFIKNKKYKITITFYKKQDDYYIFTMTISIIKPNEYLPTLKYYEHFTLDQFYDFRKILNYIII